jgi:hypothetical protein
MWAGWYVQRVCLSNAAILGTAFVLSWVSYLTFSLLPMNYRTQALAFVFASICALAAPSVAQAQVGVNVQIGQPAWGPAVPQGAQYYYIPEIDGYYDLAARNYIVQRNGRWLPVAAMPGYDPYQFHPVVVDYRGRQPWTRYNDYHARYYRSVAQRPVVVQRPVIVQQRVVERQVIVRDRNDRGRDRRDNRGRDYDRRNDRGRY